MTEMPNTKYNPHGRGHWEEDSKIVTLTPNVKAKPGAQNHGFWVPQDNCLCFRNYFRISVPTNVLRTCI